MTLPGGARLGAAGLGPFQTPPRVTDDETIVPEHRVVCVGAAAQVGGIDVRRVSTPLPVPHPPWGPCSPPFPFAWAPLGARGGQAAPHRPVFKFCIVHLLSLILNHLKGSGAGGFLGLLEPGA